jgi:hypothetical protein
MQQVQQRQACLVFRTSEIMGQGYIKGVSKSIRHFTDGVPPKAAKNAWNAKDFMMLEARGGVEPPIKVLQTFALPLGDRASVAKLFYQTQTPASPLLSPLRCRDSRPKEHSI